MNRSRLIEEKLPVRFLSEVSRIETHTRKPVYTMHRWWAERSGSVFRGIILGTFLSDTVGEREFRELFYRGIHLNGKIIVDPFMGSGPTIVEGLRLGCKVIGIELNPVAWFITKKEIESVDIDKLLDALKKLKSEVAPKIKEFYKTICPSCGKRADIVYVFWVRKIKCEKCSKDVPLFPSFKLAEIKKKSKKEFVVFCPKCLFIFRTHSEDEEVVCPKCGAAFVPSLGYAPDDYYICPHCQHNSKIVSAVKKEKALPSLEMVAIEYYCPYCDKRGYKPVEEYDKLVYEESVKEFEKRKRYLIYPTQKIPLGKETKRLFNYNFKYFYEFFNKRQLLCLSSLLKSILKIKDENIREFLLLAFSHCLDFNNMFARYNYKAKKIEPMFAHHAYYPKKMPTENNVWGTKYGRCSFIKCVKLVINGKKYCKKPYEYYPAKPKSKTKIVYAFNDKIEGNFANNFDELLNDNKNVILKCQSSEDLSFIPDKSVDAVITDPPYFDYVIYSELADFYYVWLRLALKDKYEYFKPEYSPREQEIVVNVTLRKDRGQFLKGITKVFKECRRILKDEGLLIFTFHHKKDEAWVSILRAVMDAGFYISAIFPVYAEMRTSFHILRRKAALYDTIIVCKKKEKIEGSITLSEIVNEALVYAKKTIMELYSSNQSFTDIDILMAGRSKCIELYSKYYPNVRDNRGSIPSILDVLRIVDRRLEMFLEDETDLFHRACSKNATLDEFIK